MNWLKLKTYTTLFTLCMACTAWSESAPVSLRNEIGQMLIVGFDGTHIDRQSWIVRAMHDVNLGGVILFDYQFKTKTFDKNIQNATQVLALNQQLQHFNQEFNIEEHRPQLPLLISVDYEGGLVTRLQKKYGFPEIPSPAAVGAMSTHDATQVAHTMAMTLKNTGFNLTFAPLLDVNINPQNPVIGHLDRSFSSDPHMVAHYANIYTDEFLNNNIQCAYKHFPGHGSSTTDSHLGFVDVTSTWKAAELEPYKELLSGPHPCGVVMSAHIVNRQLDESGLPATLSYKMLTGVLRDQLKFQGVIVTDDLQMKAISEHYSLQKTITLAINAGADLLIFGNQLIDEPQDPRILVDLIEKEVNAGHIKRQRIDEAYARVMHLKLGSRAT